MHDILTGHVRVKVAESAAGQVSTLVQLKRRGNDRLGPLGCVHEVAAVAYFPAHHVEHKFRFGAFAGGGVGVRAIVVDAQCG